MDTKKFALQAASESDGEEHARRQAYVAWSRKQWRKSYYRK